jgi:hypothetical protein
MNPTTIKSALRSRAREFIDDCGELNCTLLVESVAVDLDIDPQENDVIWDWAVEIAKRLGA